jgi:hypothetical protein
MEAFDGPIDQAPWMRASFSERRQAVVEALAGLELGEWDQRIVSWPAGWDSPTVVPIISWLRRVHRTGNLHRPAAMSSFDGLDC